MRTYLFIFENLEKPKTPMLRSLKSWNNFLDFPKNKTLSSQLLGIGYNPLREKSNISNI